jgi:hypothetical protein
MQWLLLLRGEGRREREALPSFLPSIALALAYY